MRPKLLLTFLLPLGLWGQNTAAPPHSDVGLYTLVVTGLLALAGQFVQAYFKNKKEERERRLDMEERRQLAADLRSAQNELKQNQMNVQAKLMETSLDLKKNTSLTNIVAQKVTDVVVQMGTGDGGSPRP